MSNRILICSQDPMFIKVIYGPLRDAGYDIETGEHPNDAVRSVLHKPYSAVILDSGDFGLNASDAAAIIKNLKPDIHIILISNGPDTQDLYTVKKEDAAAHIRELFVGATLPGSSGFDNNVKDRLSTLTGKSLQGNFK